VLQKIIFLLVFRSLRSHAGLPKKQFFFAFKFIALMKKIGSFLDKRKLTRKTVLDQESIFYIFKQVIKEEYGKQGAENIKPIFFKDKKIFVKATGSIWVSEILTNKKHIIKKVNEQLGGEEIADLAMSQ
jgi:hypothetical protein